MKIFTNNCKSIYLHKFEYISNIQCFIHNARAQLHTQLWRLHALTKWPRFNYEVAPLDKLNSSKFRISCEHKFLLYQSKVQVNLSCNVHLTAFYIKQANKPIRGSPYGSKLTKLNKKRMREKDIHHTTMSIEPVNALVP